MTAGADRVLADITVIGAGIAGVSAAASLARRHPGRVVLVEREPFPAQHASGRSAAVLSETSGQRTVCALARLSRPWFEHTRSRGGHDLLAPRGLVWVGDESAACTLDELAAAGTRIRPSVERISPARARALLPGFSDEALAGGGVHEPEAMAIDTAAVIDTLLGDLRDLGGRMLTADEALVLEPASGGSWTVRTASATIQCGQVVNAAGAWADTVAVRAGLEPLGLQPLRRTAAVAPAPDHVRDWPLVMDAAGRYYCEPDPGGLLISPADETPSAPCDARPDELDVALALERVREATGLPLRSVRRAWAGLRTFAADRAPVLGEDPRAPGFWWLAGQGGAGMKTAPAMASLLTIAMHGDALPTDAAELGIALAALSPARSTGRPGGEIRRTG